jgi:hypothetical protein
MTPADVLAVLRRRPFEPFRIVTTDGTTHDVRHPDLVFVSLGSLIVGYPDRNEPNVASTYDIVSMQHIIRLEQILPDRPPAPVREDG